MPRDEAETDELVQEVADALLQVLILRPDSGIQDRVFAAGRLRESKEFKDLIEKKLRSIFRVKPKPPWNPLADSRVKKMKKEEGEERRIGSSDSDHDFDPSDEDWSEVDSFNESDNDFKSEPEEYEDCVASTSTMNNQPFGMGWTAPPPYLGPPQQLSSFSPFSPFIVPMPIPASWNGGNDFDSTPPHSPPHSPHSPRAPKIPRSEEENRPSVSSEEWSSDDADRQSRARERSSGRPNTARIDTTPLRPSPMLRAGTPPPWVRHPIPGRRILGEIPVPKDEFASDEDEETFGSTQPAENVQPLQATPPSQHSPLLGSAIFNSPPYSPPSSTQDENYSPVSTAGSTGGSPLSSIVSTVWSQMSTVVSTVGSQMSSIGDTPPPSSIESPSVFTPLSIGTSIPHCISQLADAIFQKNSPEDDALFDSD